MNLFACEDNVFKWSQTDPDSADGIKPVQDWVAMFSTDLFKRRLDPDYLSRIGEYAKQNRAVLVERGMTGPWFMRPR